MADGADASRRGDAPATTDDARFEAYRTETTVVLYDSRNPLAWIESTRATPIDDAI